MTTQSKRDLYLATPVKLVSKENPKKPNSMSYERFQGYFECEEKYPDGYTIGQAYRAGVRGDDIRHDHAHGFILVGQDEIDAAKEPAEVEPKAKSKK